MLDQGTFSSQQNAVAISVTYIRNSHYCSCYKCVAAFKAPIKIIYSWHAGLQHWPNSSFMFNALCSADIYGCQLLFNKSSHVAKEQTLIHKWYGMQCNENDHFHHWMHAVVFCPHTRKTIYLLIYNSLIIQSRTFVLKGHLFYIVYQCGNFYAKLNTGDHRLKENSKVNQFSVCYWWLLPRCICNRQSA